MELRDRPIIKIQFALPREFKHGVALRNAIFSIVRMQPEMYTASAQLNGYTQKDGSEIREIIVTGFLKVRKNQYTK